MSNKGKQGEHPASPTQKESEGRAMAEIILDNENMSAFVDDFKGFTDDWDEIVLPYDEKAVQLLELVGYTIEYGHDDI